MGATSTYKCGYLNYSIFVQSRFSGLDGWSQVGRFSYQKRYVRSLKHDQDPKNTHIFRTVPRVANVAQKKDIALKLVSTSPFVQGTLVTLGIRKPS